MQLKTLLLIIIGVVSYGAWGAFAFFDPAVRPDFLRFNVMTAIGVIGLVLRDMKPASTSDAAPPDKQAGKASPWLLASLASILMVVVVGCAQIGLQPAQSFDEKLAYSYGTIATIRVTTASALTSGSIKAADAEQVQLLADQARALLDSARALEGADTQSANGKLLLASTILIQLQNYVASKGVK